MNIVSLCLNELQTDAAGLAGSPRHLVRKLSARVYRTVKAEGWQGVRDHCEALLEARHKDMRLIAFDWAFRCRNQYTTEDFSSLEGWLDRYVDGWDSCDDLCTHALGALIDRYPETVDAVKAWTDLEGQWMRRGAAVSLIYAVRRGRLIDEAFAIADALLDAPEDLVQKGYGWLLKESAATAPQEVFRFVTDRRDKMPRTAYRYAIEKLDPELRKKAMSL